MLLSAFSACAGAVFQLQHETVPARSMTNLYGKRNMVGEVEVLEYKSVDTSVCCKPSN